MFEALKINVRRIVRTRLRAYVAASKSDLESWRKRPYLQDFVPLGETTSDPEDKDGGVIFQMLDAEMLIRPRQSYEHIFVVNNAGRQIGHVGLFGDTPFKLLQRLETRSTRYVTHMVQVIYYVGKHGKHASLTIWSIPRGRESTYHYCLGLVNEAGRQVEERRAKSARQEDDEGSTAPDPAVLTSAK